MTSTFGLRPTALSAFCTWLTWERWSGLVNLRTADSLTPSLPASSTLVMRWDLIAEYRASLAATTAGWHTGDGTRVGGVIGGGRWRRRGAMKAGSDPDRRNRRSLRLRGYDCAGQGLIALDSYSVFTLARLSQVVRSLTTQPEISAGPSGLL